MPRKIIYVSGTRADFGLIQSTLSRAMDRGLDISVCVTGMHLAPEYGNTIDEITLSGLRVCDTIPVSLDQTTGANMARAIGRQVIGMVDTFAREKPDMVLVLGDRGEMLAGALAAIHMNIPVVHIHGGERSGSVDESIRHAVSKLAHYHFVSTNGARRRLIRMGELPERIFVTGAPGLDGLRKLAHYSRYQLCRKQKLDPKRPVGLLVFHPVLQEAEEAGRQMAILINAALSAGLQLVILMPNADAGGQSIRAVIERYRDHPDCRCLVHLSRPEFVNWMAVADIMVGNSSSGIIEAATCDLPVINVGNRQCNRERNHNVTDAPVRKAALTRAIRQALAYKRRTGVNIYGDGRASQRIVRLLKRLPIKSELMQKTNAY